MSITGTNKQQQQYDTDDQTTKSIHECKIGLQFVCNVHINIV